MRLNELCGDWLNLSARLRDLEVGGIACDSRRVRPHDLFVAVPGEIVDGHEFMNLAAEAGAVAIVGERKIGSDISTETTKIPYLRVDNAKVALGRLSGRYFQHPSRELALVGVTGTKGKTTTTWLLDAILRSTGRSCALFGTVENRFAGRTEESINTTPGCLDLHGWLKEHRETGGSHAVLEVSSHAIAQRRLEGIDFNVGVFTNVAPEHLDYHKTFEEYRATKQRFFEELSPDAYAVISRDDEASRAIAESTQATIVWYGSESQDGVTELRVTHDGLSFRWKDVPVRSKLLGYHNLLNLLAAMNAAECLGVPHREIAEAASLVSAPPGRLQDIATSEPFRVVVDYAHTDGSLEAVLSALRPVTPGRLITIFGCGGDRDRTKRPRMGRVAEAGSDQVIVTSDNPRTEDPSSILWNIQEGLVDAEQAEFIEDRREAIGLGIRMARAGDTVLIAGKGHETYQEFADETIHFDDREVAREFLSDSLVTGSSLRVPIDS
ncbi:MAG: UDP-N-acetylmuramoyl-L-alanyl-D-glutamate--2,6-diaminopimelate ligase [Planctomycetota bacterium]